MKKDLSKQVRPDPVVLAFDIETTKLPLKFPDANIDSVMMISYMVDGRGYLIVNREIVSQDIDDFEFTPKPEYEGHFKIFNVENEKSLLLKFYEHFQVLKPTVIVTYNGDLFDWPFIEARSKVHGIDLYRTIGFYRNVQGEYCSTFAAHMDAYKWVKRDSYLPAGSQGLKAVTTIKLGYNPDEIDPEDMTRFAREQPQTLASYSVSDAVATYYLYMKYVHPFVFSLCMIIPLSPDEILRKGSGTLCETLLMAEAYKANVIMPNKHVDASGRMYNGHLIESETYVGGHVEALESGVFRSDLPTKFNMSSDVYQKLMDDLDRALKFSIVFEGSIPLETIENYDEVFESIKSSLCNLRDKPVRFEEPLIYHLDVAAMYPNIILTNRLQPSAMVDDSFCASCDYNVPEKNCQRKMSWAWRGEFFTAKRNEYRMIKNQIETERFFIRGKSRSYNELLAKEQEEVLYKRLSEYCRKVYHKIRDNEVVIKESVVCMRENSFYVDTVKRFRDRRYDYKNLHKEWKKKLDESVEQGNIMKIEEGKKMNILYDSLQLAHKCILNSFYGYVMRKGARWYSMDMAGIVCHTGSAIITLARELVEQVGRPLELDTDGIWCILPSSFPQNFSFKLKNGKKYEISYPCVMLNHLVHDKFTNDQYQTLQPDGTYKVTSENSIFFEIDGPYKAMILPSSKEEGKLLKKRYAVFNMNGSIAELKGFEIKRRGELKLIKIFQSQIFKTFLDGSTLEECYDSAAQVANHWLDILYTKGENVEDFELFELISENRNMSKSLEEYGEQKSTSISTAKRLSEFLGDQMIKDKGLACKFIISLKPAGDPVASRAIPIAIFSAEEEVKKYYLRKWLKDQNIDSFDIRDILDWNYYIERLESVIQKLITIPAAMQKVPNPVPRVKHPDWLFKKTENKNSAFTQTKFSFSKLAVVADTRDIEDVSKEISVNHIPVEESVMEEEKKIPEIDDNYPDWLSMKKKQWKQNLADRKKMKELGTFVSKGSGISSYFSANSYLSSKVPLQVIQIQSTPMKGELKAWIFLNGLIQPIRLMVPKIFYLNSRVENSFNDVPLNRVYQILPRSQKSYYLYEVVITEEEFSSKINIFSRVFNHSSIEGVYETKVDPVFRAISSLGCVCSVDSKTPVSSQIDYRLFKTGSVNQQLCYLDSSCFNYIFLFSITLANRKICALFFSKTNNARVYVCEENARTDLIDWNDQFSERMNNFSHGIRNGPFKFSSDFEWEQKSFTSEKSFLKAIKKALTDYSESNRGQNIVIMESQEPLDGMLQMIPILNDFPILTFPFSFQNLDAFQLIDWQRYTCRTVIDHLLSLNQWITDRIAASKYSNIPMGNFEGDLPIKVADVMFARILQGNGHLMWYSPDPKPDLGGRENDEVSVDFSNALSECTINNPAHYQSICCELELNGLALNSILESGLLCELEGVDMFDNMDGMVDHLLESRNEFSERESVEESQISKKIYGMIRSLIAQWTRDFLSSKNPFCEKLLNNFYRWLNSSRSAFFDGSICHKIKLIINKMFFQLLFKIKSLGCQIVHANYSKIIVSTKKDAFENAQSYINFVVKEVQNSELFSWLHITPVQYWQGLYWLDYRNYAANCITEAGESKLFMNFSMIECLPKGLCNAFKAIVAEFMTMSSPVGISDDQVSMLDEKSSNYFSLPLAFSQKYLNMIREIERSFNGQYADAAEASLKSFPQIPGVSTRGKNAPLEFIKFTCAVLQLNSSREDGVSILKRNALKLIGVKEFSDEADFYLPQVSFQLSDQICASCSHIVDFDINLMEEIDEKTHKWICPYCNFQFSNWEIESALLHVAKSQVILFFSQDLYCVKCKAVREKYLSNHCDCSSPFKLGVSPSNVIERLRILRAVAEKYNFAMLQESTEKNIGKSK